MNKQELKHFGMGGLTLVPMEEPASSLFHHGVKGMKWGVRRYQNEDGTRTKAGIKLDSKTYKRISKGKSMTSAQRQAYTAILEDLIVKQKEQNSANGAPNNPKLDRARKKEIIKTIEEYNGGKAKGVAKRGGKFIGSEAYTKVILGFYDQYNSKIQTKMDKLDMDVEELRGEARTKAVTDRDRYRKEVYTKWHSDTKNTYNRKMAEALLKDAGVDKISDQDVDYVREKFKTDAFL